ncbi:hypothetical protein R6Q57_007660 [Mikania cordata]
MHLIRNPVKKESSHATKYRLGRIQTFFQYFLIRTSETKAKETSRGIVYVIGIVVISIISFIWQPGSNGTMTSSPSRLMVQIRCALKEVGATNPEACTIPLVAVCRIHLMLVYTATSVGGRLKCTKATVMLGFDIHRLK